jgi:predicted phage terminase large subunit-like protein
LSLTPEAIHGLTMAYLLEGYDNPKPVPDFHWQMWGLCCSDEQYVAMAAPRGSAKSTAITHAYVLAMTLLGYADFVLVVSDTETQATEFLGDIKAELSENQALRRDFGIKKLLKETETNVICLMKDGRMFRITAKGSEQKVRGLKWRNKRPDLIVGDDLENEEIVMNPERREKFRRWVSNTLLPCGSDDCRYRFVGTILHLDAWLARILDDPEWASLKFAAHNKDFSFLLWPEKFTEKRLKAIRAKYISQGDLSGYSQEYLNSPIAEGNEYFRPEDFIEMDAPDHETPKEYVAAIDMAISEKERADFTCIMVAGVDPNGVIHIVDCRTFRGDSLWIIDEMFSVQARYKPDLFVVETEKIDKALGPFLNARMMKDGQFMNIHKMTPSKSKLVRGRSVQAMMKAGAVRFDKNASWYPALESELMTVTESGIKGRHDDMFDTFAYIGLGIDLYREADTVEESDDYDYWEAVDESMDDGRCASTGY